MLRRVRDLEDENAEQRRLLEEARNEIALLKEQISGERGISAAIRELAEQVAGVRRAALWVGGILITASIGFAFGVLALIPA